ncbi:MAG: hypothetical protein OEZ31_02565 [Nitrospirota bacterium]|nr:hypothetical protein [Nitrospirota bacterium]
MHLSFYTGGAIVTITLISLIAKIPPNGIADSIGLDIIDPSPRYLAFVKALH